MEWLVWKHLKSFRLDLGALSSLATFAFQHIQNSFQARDIWNVVLFTDKSMFTKRNTWWLQIQRCPTNVAISMQVSRWQKPLGRNLGCTFSISVMDAELLDFSQLTSFPAQSGLWEAGGKFPVATAGGKEITFKAFLLLFKVYFKCVFGILATRGRPWTETGNSKDSPRLGNFAHHSHPNTSVLPLPDHNDTLVWRYFS